MQKAAKAGMGCLGLMFAGFVLIMIRRPEQADAGTKAAREAQTAGYTAAYTCQDAVRARLKAPAGAEFQGVREAAIKELDNGNYRISSYVDAANSFGAKLRTPYTCLVSGREVIGLEIAGANRPRQ
jgi:hypothetical protein